MSMDIRKYHNLNLNLNVPMSIYSVACCCYRAEALRALSFPHSVNSSIASDLRFHRASNIRMCIHTTDPFGATSSAGSPISAFANQLSIAAVSFCA